jgi:glycosyl transferase family 25
MPSVDIYLINTDAATDRLAFQRAQFARLGLAFERLAAVSPDDLDDADYVRRKSHGVRPVSRSELCCLLSHAACWQRVVERNRPALVLEDDVVLSERLPVMLDRLAASTDRGIVNLETYGTRRKSLSRRVVPVALDPPFLLRKVIKGSAGAAGYLIAPSDARALLSRLSRETWIADTFLGLCAPRPHLQLVPAMAMQLMHLPRRSGQANPAAQSTISRRAPVHEKTVGQTLRRARLELYVGFEKLQGYLFGETFVVPPCETILSPRSEDMDYRTA